MRNNCILSSGECFDGSCPRHHQGRSAGGRDGNTTINYSLSTKTTLRERMMELRTLDGEPAEAVLKGGMLLSDWVENEIAQAREERDAEWKKATADDSIDKTLEIDKAYQRGREEQREEDARMVEENAANWKFVNMIDVYSDIKNLASRIRSKNDNNK